MRVLSTYWRCIRRHRTVLAIGVLICAAYFSTWSLRRELGLVHPMANLHYFYFGGAPDALSDRVLYWFYYPAYRSHLAYQMIRHGERYDVHWSDRRDPVLPTVGGAWQLGGLPVTIVSYSLAASSPGGGHYVIATGAMLYGLLRLLRGLRAG